MSKGDISDISDIGDISYIIKIKNMKKKRRCFYELQPRNPKEQIR